MLACHFLRSLVKSGDLTVIDADGKSHRFAGRPGPRVAIRLHDRTLHHRLLISPHLAIGEAYMDGSLTIEGGSLYDLLELGCRNIAGHDSYPLQRLQEQARRVLRAIHTYNPITRARKNVAHHYDLSGALYGLFLDNDRQYSCAYFVSGNDSLEVAQDNKKRHLAAKLLLRPGQRLLDIGSGWGGLGLYLSRVADIDVTGVTLSVEQQKVSEERARQAGLGNRTRFHLRDYREVTGKFDRIVSVGMFEHVGTAHYAQFFGKVRDLLTDDGIMLLHSIGRKGPPSGTDPWIRKYIFPGGYTPALSEVFRAIERAGLWVTDVEILRLHYAATLREWRRRFQLNHDKIRSIYDDRFCRMWDFYLTGCELAFRHLGQMVFQLQISRQQDAVPLTRDYITDFERTYAGRAMSAA